MARINFAFDSKTQRYRYTTGRNKGKFVGQGKVRSLIRSYIKQEAEKAVAKTDEMLEKKITLREWERWQAENLKKVALQIYKINNPSLGTVASDPRAFSKIANYLKSTYTYLRNFANEIKQGKLSPAQIKARIRLYYEDLNYLAEESKRESHKESDFKWERRMLAIAEHCPDCLAYAAKGWQRIGTLPAITTQCQCKANDKCYFEYSKSLLKPETNSMGKWGWVGNGFVPSQNTWLEHRRNR